jgi:subtilisin family serine protease
MGSTYKILNGTSMATPHVCGVVALIAKNNPSLSPVQIQDILTGTAENLGLPANQQGAGLVDAEAAQSASKPVL